MRAQNCAKYSRVLQWYVFLTSTYNGTEMENLLCIRGSHHDRHWWNMAYFWPVLQHGHSWAPWEPKTVPSSSASCYDMQWWHLREILLKWRAFWLVDAAILATVCGIGNLLVCQLASLLTYYVITYHTIFWITSVRVFGPNLCVGIEVSPI
jgi:hypothetical protein